MEPDATDRVEKLASKLSEVSFSLSSQQRSRKSLVDARLTELDRKVEALSQRIEESLASFSMQISSTVNVRERAC